MHPTSPTSRKTRRHGHADNYMVFGYMVPESFLLEEGWRILPRAVVPMCPPHKSFRHHLQATDEAITQARRIIDSVMQCGEITREILVGLGAWHIMAMAGLLDFDVLAPSQGRTSTLQPRSSNANVPRPEAVYFDPRDGQLMFDLHTTCGKLALVRTAGCDDQLGVGRIEYFIALTSNDRADGLPWQETIDDVPPSFAPLIRNLQCVLGTENLPTWYPAVRDYQELHGVPEILSLILEPQTLGDSASQPTPKKRVLVAKRESRRKEPRLVY